MAGWGPYAYFRALEEIRSPVVSSSNGISMREMNHQQSGLDPNADSGFDAMEAGRR